MLKSFTLALFLLSLTSAYLPANNVRNEVTYDLTCCVTQKIAIGPEVYFMNRQRKAGSRQSGGVFGLRASYERIKPWGIYLCTDCLYASGFLHGRTPLNDSIKSNYSDQVIEGRLGFTVPFESFKKLLFTPYVGYGYFIEKNKYRPPSPMNLHFKIYFPYFAGGFLSSMALNQCFRLGFNFKAFAMYEGKCKVTNDPEFDDVTMLIEDRVSYRLELPLNYHCYPCTNFGLGFVPFYEWRHYGGRVNFPFNFIDTKVNVYGLNLQILYRF